MEIFLHPTWQDIAIRILFTVLAGAALGVNRGARGHAAGLRTTILVGLAASAAMIQANILLSASGKAADFFGVIDPMRLPLGILTGMGFIGGGTILKRGELVTGVTTAATLWVMTVIGLCFGGGQLSLGIIITVLSVLTLGMLKKLDNLIPRDHHARLLIKADETLSVSAINTLIEPLGYHARFQRQSEDLKTKHLEFEILWTKSGRAGLPLDLVQLLEKNFKVESLEITAEKIDI